MNKKIALILAAVICLSVMAGCGAEKTDETATTKTVAQTEASTSTEKIDVTEAPVTAVATEKKQSGKDKTVKTQPDNNSFEYTDYTSYIGKSCKAIKNEFGSNFATEDCVSTLLYKYESRNLGFHFDNFDEITDEMQVRMVRVYGDTAVNSFLKANMTYSELKTTVGDKTSVPTPEQYSDTDYSVQISYKGVTYTFMYEGDPSEDAMVINDGAKFVDVSE